jgi:hypothetical protein
MNHKTVHRAYTALAREGILEVRPGSGTFVTERRSGADGHPPTLGLLGALDRCRDEAARLGLAPAVLSRFLHCCLADGLRGAQVGLVECNWDQITMIGQDVRHALGVQVRPILLSILERDPVQALGRVRSVVTTDCHWSLVAGLLEPHGVPTYTITFDQSFPRYLLQVMRQNTVMLVVHDLQFGRVFIKLLKQLADDTELLKRLRVVSERRAPQALASAEPGTSVYLTPLVRKSLEHALPSHVHRVHQCWHVEPSSLESLRAGLALDQSLRAEALC